MDDKMLREEIVFQRRPMSVEELQDAMTRVFFAARDLRQISKNAHLKTAGDAGKCAEQLDAWLQKTSKHVEGKA